MRLRWAGAILLAGCQAAQAAPRDPDWPVGKTAQTLPFAVRCGLVKEIFSDAAFQQLYAYANGSCVRMARVGGRAQVMASVLGQPQDAGEAANEWLFARNERCEDARFKVLGLEELSHLEERHVAQLDLTPIANGRFRFGMAVAVLPNAIAGCTTVSGEAVLRGRRWKLRPVAESP